MGLIQVFFKTRFELGFTGKIELGLFGFILTFSTDIYMKMEIHSLFCKEGEKQLAEKVKHTGVGIASIIFGILGLILYFIGLFFYSFVDNRLYGITIGIILGIIAIILGYLAKKQEDNYGSYGISLGVLILIIGLLTFLLTTPTYVETGYSS
jgi:hypothetical protein